VINSKLKVAVYIHSTGSLNWLHYGITSKLNKALEIKFILTKDLSDLRSSTTELNNAIIIEDDRAEWVYKRAYEVKLLENRSKSASFTYRLKRFLSGNLISNPVNLKTHPSLILYKLSAILNYIKSNPFIIIFYSTTIRKLFKKFLDRYIERAALNYFPTRDFDLIIIPSSGIETRVNKMIKECKKTGIHTMVAIENWDNLTSKGLFLETPTFLSVMGQLCKSHVLKMYDFPEKDILVNGLPRFENYGFRHKQDKKHNKIRILYLGFSLPHNEINLINLLLPKLNEILGHKEFDFIYRPHPARQKRFYDGKLENHPSLIIVEPIKGPNIELPLISSEYIQDFLESDLVISTPTTMALESIMLGLPTLIDGTNDGIHRTSAKLALNNFTHLKDLKEVYQVNIADSVQDLVEKCSLLLSQNKSPANPSIKKLISVQTPYSRGLIDFIFAKFKE
jgi:hypothetical protein